MEKAVSVQLGNNDKILITVEGKDILLCGSPNALDDEVFAMVSNIFEEVEKVMGNHGEGDITEPYFDDIQEITCKIIELVSQRREVCVAYQYNEF